MGIGDRFGRQGTAQLNAFVMAKSQGVAITPVWNKSFREHQIVGTVPDAVRTEADGAVQAAGWTDPYFVDADHVGFDNVDGFIGASDFFTLDVADAIGEAADPEAIESFVTNHKSLIGSIDVDGIEGPVHISRDFLVHCAEKYLFAVREAGRIYRKISARKNSGTVIEVSMDETDSPQTPEELLVILAAIRSEGIPADTIAPKFSGRFNKGVDYVGDVRLFRREFDMDLAVIRHAVRHFGMQASLKLSVHSGSDKFKLYPEIRAALRTFDAGVHLKTAGTTWLEELIGLAESGREGLDVARQVYARAYQRFDELAKPYATVIDIDPEQLPGPDAVQQWNGTAYASALRHDQGNPAYNMHFRQLLHVAYKIAAEMGDDYSGALENNRDIVARHVTDNLFKRHITPLFLSV
ncbi:hypothetical protein JW948_08830 [bacterium]|nr:hypothetical protein [bacterium]